MNETTENPTRRIENPETPFVRWSALVAWLSEWGFAESEVKKFKRAGLIEPKQFGRGARAYYRVDQVERALGLEEKQ